MFSMVDYYSDMGQLGQDCLPTEDNMDDLDLDQVTQVIGYHPRFLRHFLQTQNFIMKGDGPLPYDYRYFLAIIAAARHQCPYLVKMYEKEFLNQGGSPEWLNGLDFIPSKLRAIYEINKILAHRPWLLRKGHIESLTKGINNWSLSEVVHAMVLLSHFHALSSFVFSCGLVQKLDGLSSPKLKNQSSINQQQLHQNQYQPQQHQHQNQQYHLYQIQLQAQNHQQLQQIQGPAQQMQSHQLHQNQNQHQQHPQQKNVLSEITLNNNSMLEQQINLHQQLYSSNASNGLSLAMGGRPAHTDAGSSAGVNAGVGESSFNAISNGLIKALDVDQSQQQQQHMQLPQQPQPKQKEPQPIATVEKIMERMKLLSQIQNECSEAELSNRFKSVEIQTAELPAAAPEASIEVPPIISHYIEDPNFTYEDFARRGAENIPSTFRIQDYSWDDHGYSLVNDLYGDVGTLLDEKFRAAYNLTYFTMGGRKNVDTSKFRRAIWNYIQCIYGIRHDDYDYGEVNQLLDRPLKMFIKTACCFPERITTKDYDSILVELLDSEKVHVNLMIMEARNQAELLYALREIMRYMT